MHFDLTRHMQELHFTLIRQVSKLDATYDQSSNGSKGVMFEEHKPLNQEQMKNTRTQHSKHAYDFSLNRKYRNTHFSLVEEQRHR